jgi:hypothetical protein
MKKYFFNDGTSQLGPFTLEELQAKNINSGNTRLVRWIARLDNGRASGGTKSYSCSYAAAISF